MITVATGKELKGTGVWSFIKLDGSPTSRAAIGAAVEKNCAPAYTSSCLQKHASDKRGIRSKSSVLTLD